MDAKEEVRSKLNIEDVIGEYVQLKRAGRNFKGLSPFSQEKTPSFFVSPEKNIWHDFSSNKGGDIYAFVMEAEGIDFRSALEHLARKAGVDLSLYESADRRALAQRKKRLLEANRIAVQYYQHSLLKNQHALDYVVKKRGLKQQIIQDFGLGYAPDSGDALRGYLLRKKFTRREIADAGLSNRYGGDMFRGRMMVPLMDPSGQVLGFTGRITRDVEGAPKYLNTTQTLLYDKSRHIFGLSQAKEAIRNSGYVVIVEGNLDVISSHQAGVRQVVATAGTAITEHHLRALKRLTSDVRLCFDGDKAGLAATERAIPIASQVGVELTIVTLPPEAKDPDEMIQQDVTLWKDALTRNMPAVDWILGQYSARLDLSSAKGKRAFTNAALAVVNSLQDPVEREHYEQKIAEMVGTSVEAVRTKFAREKKPAPELKSVQKTDIDPMANSYAYQDDALAVASLDIPSQELFAHVDPSYFHGKERQAMARYFAKNHRAVLTEVSKELQEFDEYVKIVLLRADARYAEWDSNDRYYETARLIRQVENEHKKQKQAKLIADLREAEENEDETRAEVLRIELNSLIKEIARGRRR